MDLLWSPWRYDYITGGDSKPAPSGSGCIFCDILSSPASDEDKFILHRAGHNFVILNVYPYITGHLMVVPFVHTPLLSGLAKAVSDEMTDLTKQAQEILGEVYNPQGFNIGMNLGRAAGAGVADHLHQHVLPRWIGDSNFMTSIGQTRTIPESLTSTYSKLRGKFR